MNNLSRDSYLNQLEAFKDKQIIKVITGIRRCGKSVLMEQFMSRLKKDGVTDEQIIFIKLDDMEFEDLLDYKNLYVHIKNRLTKKRNYIFIDEVQLCKDFQKPVESFFSNPNCDIYLTGSNADVLSGELATLLSGRYITIEMQPLVFSEYLEQSKKYESEKNNPSIEQKFFDYEKFGGFPFTLQLEKNTENINQYLNGIYNTIIVKDIARRHQINDISTLESVIKFIFSNTANILSSKKIADTLTSGGRKVSQPTVENYLHFLQECFLIYRVERFDVRGKEILKSLAKYYIADSGLRNTLLGYRNIDTGHLLENLVFLELKKRRYKIFVGKNQEAEIDFVLEKQNQIIYVQVSESIKEKETFNRELGAFKNINDNYPKIIITSDRIPNTDFNGIKIINSYDFFMGAEI